MTKVICIARVHVAALNLDLGACGVEVLVLQFALEAAVHRVGEVGAERLHVEMIHAAAHLLVGREADADLAVLDLGVRHQVLRGRHDLGYAGLVVGAEQRRAVGVDERVAHEFAQLGEVGHAHGDLPVERNVAAVVLLDDARLDVRAAHVGRRVHVGDEAHDGGVLAALRRGDRAHRVAVGVGHDLREAQRAHFVGQVAQQHQLLVGRGVGFARLRTLGVEGDVLQESVFEFHGMRCVYGWFIPLFSL